MKCLSKIVDPTGNIEYGDILVYSEYQAFLIANDYASEKEAIAIQIFNNGNDELGAVDFAGQDMKSLLSKLYNTYGKPNRIVNVKDVSITLE